MDTEARDTRVVSCIFMSIKGDGGGGAEGLSVFTCRFLKHGETWRMGLRMGAFRSSV